MFLSNLQIAAQQVIILYLMVAVGFFADKSGLYKEKTARMSNELLFYIVTPAVITQSFLSMDFNKENLTALGISTLCGFVLHFAGIIITLPFFRKGNKDENALYKYSAIYGNVGYMALPMANALLGARGVFYCSGGFIAFQVVCFTHGVWLMSNGKGFDAKKLIVNPGVISVAIGLPLYLLQVQLPTFLSQPIDYIASINTPLAMIMFGTYLANTDIKSMFKNKNIYLVSLLKLIVLPITVLLLFRLCGVKGALLTACAISASAPTANNTVMFAAKYDKDTGLASKTVALVSFISIITMPVMIGLAGTL